MQVQAAIFAALRALARAFYLRVLRIYAFVKCEE
jgi:hypothetical protein